MWDTLIGLGIILGGVIVVMGGGYLNSELWWKYHFSKRYPHQHKPDSDDRSAATLFTLGIIIAVGLVLVGSNALGRAVTG